LTSVTHTLLSSVFCGISNIDSKLIILNFYGENIIWF
jgi:hypothetical protein